MDCAVATTRLWQMAGIACCYYVSRFLCSVNVIYALVTSCVLATVAFVTSEIRLRLREQEVRSAHDQSYLVPEVDSATWIPTLNPLTQRKRSALITFPAQQKLSRSDNSQ